MAYEPTVWKDGDVISAEKLNKIENAIGGVYYVDISEDRKTLSTTWQDVYDAYQSGKQIVGRQVVIDDNNNRIFFYILAVIGSAENHYYVVFGGGGSTMPTYSSDSATGQLTFESPVS